MAICQYGRPVKCKEKLSQLEITHYEQWLARRCKPIPHNMYYYSSRESDMTVRSESLVFVSKLHTEGGIHSSNNSTSRLPWCLVGHHELGANCVRVAATRDEINVCDVARSPA